MRTVALLTLFAVAACGPHLGANLNSASPRTATVFVAIDTAGASAVAERWWRAFTFGDTAYLRRHTSPRAAVTLSGGPRFHRDVLLRDAATNVPGPTAFVRPAVDVAVLTVGGAVVVTSSTVEGTRNGSNVYRYLAVLERPDFVWMVDVAQSTRVLELTPRVPAAVAGPLTDYVCQYRVPGGGALRAVVRDSALGLIDPSGAEARREPIGPSLFELPSLYDGIAVVRFVFARDATGRVTSLSRLIYSSVRTWPRIP